MATEEYLDRFIAGGKRYAELPDRFKLTVTEEDWRRRVKDYCIARGFSWAVTVANTVCNEQDYYEELIRHFRYQKRLFPYHLGEYVCRQLRLSPFKYYTNIVYDSMKEDQPYDSIPNFTAADIVRILGIGRNEYIAIMVQAKSKKLMWRMNKGIVKDLLPQAPLPPQIDPWWVVHVVNLTESEYRQLDPAEATVCHIAARPGGARYSDLNGSAVRQLYARGLVWLEVPVRPEDHLSIPPLEGFVSNKTTAAAAADPLETLLYQIFVAASDRVTVAKLADILNVDVPTLRVAISMACRLRFCRKLDGGGEEAAAVGGVLPSPGGLAGALEQLDLDAMLRTPAMDADASPLESAHESAEGGAAAAAAGGSEGGTGVAFVVDAQVTGYLMMGALTPNCKKHSVTLFEGGRVYGKDVINELIDELHASVEMSAGFEGEMKSLVDYARSLALVLECIRSGASGRPIELLRKESLASMPPPQAFRILSHSYGVVLPITSLAFPPLPLSNARPASPASYGPLPAAQTPWLQLALYTALGTGPRSLVLAAGQRLSRLPPQLRCASHALLWPWDAAAVKAQELPVVVEAGTLLYALNEYLARTALLVQPLRLPPGSSPVGGSSSRPQLSEAAPITTIDVPLPLTLLPPAEAPGRPSSGQGGAAGPAAAAAAAAGDSWNPFESGGGSGNGTSSDGGGDHGASSGSSSAGSNQLARAVGYLPSGDAQEVVLPPGLPAALQHLGLGGALGFLRLLAEPPEGEALAGAAGAADGGTPGDQVGGSSEQQLEQGQQQGEQQLEQGQQQGEQRWLPLALWLGMPMQPCQLCRAVCNAAMAGAFLEPAALRAQREGQAALAAALATRAAAHGACSTAFAGGGRDDDLGSFVDRPVQNLELLGGRLVPADLGGAAEGAPLLLG